MKSKVNIIGLLLGLILFILLLIFEISPENKEASRLTAVAVLMAVWWITEALPLGITALLPVVLFPILGILNAKVTSSEYFNSTIFLFLGGFLIAIAMEKWNLHKRISLLIIRLIGSGPSGLILGFMVSAAFLSMFISNTATAIMMLPIGLAVIIKMEETYSKSKVKIFSSPLMLGIAYGASVGGIATLVGTPPNLAFIRIYQITFPQAPEISFGNWMILALPISILMLFIIWILLTRVMFKIPSDLRIEKSIIQQEYKELGQMSYEEKIVLSVFISTGLLWIFRTDLNFGDIIIPGWSRVLSFPKYIDDSTVAIFMSILLFILPAKSKLENHILTIPSLKKVPWDIILLFGGGFALAKGFDSSGLSGIVGSQFTGLEEMHPIIMISMVSFALTFLTELTSNTATTQTLLPILASLAVAMKVNPLFLMIPATLSASCAFMLPVATPPNAIVFGSGRINIREMVRVGIIINFIGIIVITILFYFLGDFVFGINPNVFPEWAVP